MAQVTIYLPDVLAKRVRRAAKRSNKSLSAWLADLAARAIRPPSWPKSFTELYGSCSGELEVPEDPAPEEIEPM